MNKGKKHRAITAWLLLLVFITPIIAKDIHVLEYECCAGSCSDKDKKNSHSKHDCTNCHICQFAFSLFIDIEPYKDSTNINSFGCRIFIFYQNIDSLPAIETHFKRGPPHIFSV